MALSTIEPATLTGKAVIVADEVPSEVAAEDTPTRLRKLAVAIHAEHAHVVRGTDAKFAIGRALLAVRELLPSTRSYGAWFRSQGFPFGIRTGHNYCSAADLEPRVREIMARSERISGQPTGFTEALKRARLEGADGIRSRAPPRPGPRGRPSPHWARLVAAGDVSESALDSVDPYVAWTEWLKLVYAVEAEAKERAVAVGITRFRRGGRAS
jgi:hypothetical protein